METAYGQDSISPLERRNLILEEDQDFSHKNPNLRHLEFELLGIQQTQSQGCHLKLFEIAMKTAARNLKDILQVVGRMRGSTRVPKKLLGKAHILLWDVKNRYTPASPQFLTNGSEEVTSLLTFIHDRIVMHLKKHNPSLIDAELGRFDMSHRHTSKPRVYQPFTRRQPSAFEESRPKKLAVVTPPELINVLNMYPELSQ